MHLQFNYWHKKMNKLQVVLQAFIAALVLSTVASAQASAPVEAGKFKKETASIGSAIDDVVNATVPGYGLLQRTRATYLNGYGAIFTLEVAFEPPRNPFNSSKSPAEIRTLVAQRRKEIREKLVELIKQRAPSLSALPTTESMAIVVY